MSENLIQTCIDIFADTLKKIIKIFYDRFLKTKIQVPDVVEIIENHHCKSNNGQNLYKKALFLPHPPFIDVLTTGFTRLIMKTKHDLHGLISRYVIFHDNWSNFDYKIFK